MTPNVGIPMTQCSLYVITVETVLGETVPVMRHVPKEALDKFALDFVKVMDKLLSPMSFMSYFLFCKCTLSRRGDKRHQMDLARTVDAL